MSARGYRLRLERMSERDRKIWDLAKAATNALGFAEQMAEQGNDRAQVRLEETAAAKMEELFAVLSPLQPGEEAP